jgi:mannose-6-phosphate isomerase-like protein (cupin superfamily)
MRYVRIYSDADGSSHFEDLDIELSSAAYAPPAPPLDVSGAIAAERAVLCSFPAGWFGDWHPTPRRQLYVSLSGVLEVGVADGETRRLRPGDIVLVEDTAGTGHTTRSVGAEPSTGVFVHLADEPWAT